MTNAIVNEKKITCSLKGTVRPKKNLYYSFNCEEKLHTHVKSKIKWDNRHELFFHFLHRKPVIHRKSRKGVRGNECSGRKVKPTQLISISVEAEFVLFKVTESFFYSTLVFALCLFLQKYAFLPKKLKF